MNLGETILRLRTKTGLSQSSLAEAVGVSRQSVSKWETGAAVPDLDKLVKLAEVFGVSLDELVMGETAAAPSAQRPPESPAPRQTPARTAGVFLLCAAAVLGVGGTLLFGPGMILSVPPLVLPGLICLFAQKHPVLKAVWADFLLIDSSMVYLTGIRASMVFLTSQWTQELNYSRLAFAWVLFAAAAFLVLGTAAALRKGDYTGRKHKCLALLALAALLGSFLPFSSLLDFSVSYVWLFNIFFLLIGWARLWGATVLAVYLVRLLYHRAARRHN